MRYSSEPKYRKYVKGYSFLSFSRKCGNKYGKKLKQIEAKTETDAAKAFAERVVQKTSEATGALIGKIIVDKITSSGKTKIK